MIKKPVIAAIAFLPLAACLNFDGPKPPPTLFTLSSPKAVEVSGRSAPPGGSLTVVVPTVPAVIQPARIPVRTSATEYAYLKDARWIEAPASLFQRLLSDTIATRTKLVVLDPRQTTHDPGNRLTGQLMEFGLDVSDRTAPVVRIRYDATLGLGAGNGVANRRFVIEKPVASERPASVAQALDQAANEVAVQVADWIGAL